MQRSCEFPFADRSGDRPGHREYECIGQTVHHGVRGWKLRLHRSRYLAARDEEPRKGLSEEKYNGVHRASYRNRSHVLVDFDGD